MTRSKITIWGIGPTAVAAVALAAAPAAAVPGNGQGKPDKPEKPSKGVAYVFKGAYVGPSAAAGQGAVAVDHTNQHARAFDDQTVEFDFSSAKLSVADVSGDGQDLSDVLAGDRVVVKAKLAKSDPGAQPFSAKQLVDQTHPAPDES